MNQKTVMECLAEKRQINFDKIEKGLLGFGPLSAPIASINLKSAVSVKSQDILLMDVFDTNGARDSNMAVAEDPKSKEVLLAIHVFRTGNSQGWLLFHFNEFDKVGSEDFTGLVNSISDKQTYYQCKESEVTHIEEFECRRQYTLEQQSCRNVENAIGSEKAKRMDLMI